MIHRTRRYRVRPDAVAEARRLADELVAAVAAAERDTLVYRALQRSDAPTEFLHYMVFVDDAAEARHLQSAHARHHGEALASLRRPPPRALTALRS